MCYPIYRLAEVFVIVKTSCVLYRIYHETTIEFEHFDREKESISKKVLAKMIKACLNDEIWFFSH
ncbi:hypothetical protein SAMN04487897_111130 [Paenibacillus sp. yr247]|nr:hypothetical protein SAMN04487897_111130 [Paenibacillus sp. yr247]